MEDSSDRDSESSDSTVVIVSQPLRREQTTPPPKLVIKMPREASLSSVPTSFDYSLVPQDTETHNAFWWLKYTIKHLETTPVMENLCTHLTEKHYAKSWLCAQMESYMKTRTLAMLPSGENEFPGAKFIRALFSTLVSTSRHPCYITASMTYAEFKTALVCFFQNMSLFYTREGDREDSGQKTTTFIEEREMIENTYFRCLAVVNEEIKVYMTSTCEIPTVFLLHKEVTAVCVGNQRFNLRKRDFDQLVLDSSSLQHFSDAVTASSSSSSSMGEAASNTRSGLHINTADESGLASEESTPPASPSGAKSTVHSSPEKHRTILPNTRSTRQKAVHFELNR
jgi:hypothetical protein